MVCEYVYGRADKKCMQISSSFLSFLLFLGGRNSAVDIATGYGLDGRGVGVRVPVRARFFSSPVRPDRFWGQPAYYPVGIEGSSPGGKMAGA
jgi:hypothetical protein